MLKRSITYTNPFTDEEVTEEHFFHISKADLITMEMEEHGNSYTPKAGGEELTGMQAKLQRIIDSEDGKAIMHEFKGMIGRAYGKKDGDRFLKSQEISADFLATEAYSQLLWEICTQPDVAAEFINGIVPKNLPEIAEEVRKQAELQAKGMEAQAEAKVGGHPSDPAATPVEPSPDTVEARQKVLANATAENPVVLTEAEVRAIDSDDLKSGLATGRYKLS